MQDERTGDVKVFGLGVPGKPVSKDTVIKNIGRINK